MPGGEEAQAFFRGAARDVGGAFRQAGEKIADFAEKTAQNVEDSVDTVEAADGASADAARGIHSRPVGDGAGGADGPGPAGSSTEEARRLSEMLNGGDDAGLAAEAGEGGKRKLPDHVQKRIDDGNAFNAERRPYYEPYNEIVLESGKRIDSYVPNDEIVERKYTQLGKVKEGTANGYVSSLRNKYEPGQIIKDSPRNRELGIGGKELRGAHILEVPPQDPPVPREVLDHATDRNVTIRDTNGKEYN